MDDHRMNLNNQWVNMARLCGVLLLVTVAVVIALLGFQKGTSAEANTVKVGLVIDELGLTDPYNELINEGLLRAESDFGVVGMLYTSTSTADYEPKLQQCINDANDLCISGGFRLGDVTSKLAQTYPSQKFAIVDSKFLDGDWNHISYDNVKELIFRMDQTAFLAGYVAAGTSQTGVVATYGGWAIDAVTIHMDGFWYGVQYFNALNNANIAVLGWNPATTEGIFTWNWESFDEGYQLGNSFMAQGADIIMPVSGNVGLGTAAAAQDQGSSYIIGVDCDWFTCYPAYGNVILTSDLKKLDVAVYDTIKSVVDGDFTGGFYIGTLENNGVDLAPFHDLDDLVPDKIKSDLDTIKSDIIAGKIITSHPCGHIEHTGGFKLRECRNYLPVTFRNYCPNFFDDFSNPASGWDVFEDENALLEYLDGEYRILTKNDIYKFYYAHAPTCDRENYTVEVDARWVGDPGWHYGIFWDRNMDVNDHRYKFGVDTEYLTYNLRYFDGVEWHTPVDWTYSPYINGGIASNHLKITKNGPQIALEVNGFVLVTLTDSSFPSRIYTGIFSAPHTGYPTSDARFDNFSVTQVNSVVQSSGIRSNSRAPVTSPRKYMLALHRQNYLADSEQLIP